MKQPTPYSYRLLWKLEPRPEGVTPEQVPTGFGASDAAFLLSCLYPPDGSFSVLVMSMDGRTGAPLDDDELFKVWSMLAKRLSVSTTLSASKKDFAKQVFEVFCAAITSARDGA